MSRPDDPMAPRSGPPTLRMRPQDSQRREPAPARPGANPEQWQSGAQAGYQGGQQAAPPYHYPGQGGQEPGQSYPSNAPQSQAPARPPHYDQQPQFARYSGAHDQPGQAPGRAGEPYAPPQAPVSNGAYAPQWQQDPPSERYAARPAAAPAAPQWPPDRQGYQQPNAAQAQEPANYWPTQQPAQRSHDHGAYSPPAGEVTHGDYNGAQYAAGYQQPDPDAGYPAQINNAQYAAQYGQPQPAFEPQQQGGTFGIDGYGPQDQGYAQNHQQLGHDPNPSLIAGDQQYDAQFTDEYEEPAPRRRRGLLVAGALAAAIVVGGGSAFAFKMFGQSGKRLGPPPIVQKSSTPSKVAAAEPGGRQFDNANKKVFDRIQNGTDGADASAAGAESSPRGAAVPGLILEPSRSAQESQDAVGGPPKTKTVSTVRIGADGAPSEAPPPIMPSGGNVETVKTRPSVPGLVMDNSLNTPSGGSDAAAAAPPPRSKPQPQQRVATAAQAPATAAPKAPVAKKPAPKAANVQPAGVSAVESPPGSGSYVVVLSSQKDRMSALKAFADLQQKYPDQLSDKQPDVQEKNLGDKGVWQRLVVSSATQQSANDLCGQLKLSGYAGCWVTKN